jgi:hypothetical protein
LKRDACCVKGHIIGGVDEAREHEREIEDRGSPDVFRMFVVFLVILVLYVGSTGPVVRICIHSKAGGAVQILYLSLVMLSNRCHSLDRFLDWYVNDLWKAKG